jgi:putative YhdH/YhfP family quinone oxidoreductase
MPADQFRAYQAVTTGESVDRRVTTMSVADLPSDGVLIEGHWSSVNYKDGLASIPSGRVARISPIVPGIDLAGVVVEGDDEWPAGTAVIAHGYDIGVARHGGFAEYARVPAEWLVHLPHGLTEREAMVIGTAGYTAAQSIVALERHGLRHDEGPVLVTGASGGVGSVAVAILAQKGFEVHASTGKPDAEAFLRRLGASTVIARDELNQPGGKPLEPMVWAGAVDCVGGQTLATVLRRIQYGGAVAASGLTGGTDLPATVLPFILRGVSLLGIDSVQTHIDERRSVWRRLGDDLRPATLDGIGSDVGLDGLDAALDSILRGGQTGRAVVDVRR